MSFEGVLHPKGGASAASTPATHLQLRGGVRKQAGGPHKAGCASSPVAGCGFGPCGPCWCGLGLLSAWLPHCVGHHGRGE